MSRFPVSIVKTVFICLMSVQDEPNPALWLAKIAPSCLFRITRFVSQENSVLLSFIEELGCLVKMAEYWSYSFFACSWRQKELGQNLAILTSHLVNKHVLPFQCFRWAPCQDFPQDLASTTLTWTQSQKTYLDYFSPPNSTCLSLTMYKNF